MQEKTEPDARVPRRREGTDISVVDSEGRRVARLLGHVGSEEFYQEYQELCETLLPLAYSHFVECGILRERVKQLEKRLREAEEERDMSEGIAEDLYDFFSRTALPHCAQGR